MKQTAQGSPLTRSSADSDLLADGEIITHGAILDESPRVTKGVFDKASQLLYISHFLSTCMEIYGKPCLNDVLMVITDNVREFKTF